MVKHELNEIFPKCLASFDMGLYVSFKLFAPSRVAVLAGDLSNSVLFCCFTSVHVTSFCPDWLPGLSIDLTS